MLNAEKFFSTVLILAALAMTSACNKSTMLGTDATGHAAYLASCATTSDCSTGLACSYGVCTHDCATACGSDAVCAESVNLCVPPNVAAMLASDGGSTSDAATPNDAGVPVMDGSVVADDAALTTDAATDAAASSDAGTTDASTPTCTNGGDLRISTVVALDASVGYASSSFTNMFVAADGEHVKVTGSMRRLSLDAGTVDTSNLAANRAFGFASEAAPRTTWTAELTGLEGLDAPASDYNYDERVISYAHARSGYDMIEVASTGYNETTYLPDGGVDHGDGGRDIGSETATVYFANPGGPTVDYYSPSDFCGDDQLCARNYADVTMWQVAGGVALRDDGAIFMMPTVNGLIRASFLLAGDPSSDPLVSSLAPAVSVDGFAAAGETLWSDLTLGDPNDVSSHPDLRADGVSEFYATVALMGTDGNEHGEFDLYGTWDTHSHAWSVERIPQDNTKSAKILTSDTAGTTYFLSGTPSDWTAGTLDLISRTSTGTWSTPVAVVASLDVANSAVSAAPSVHPFAWKSCDTMSSSVCGYDVISGAIVQSVRLDGAGISGGSVGKVGAHVGADGTVRAVVEYSVTAAVAPTEFATSDAWPQPSSGSAPTHSVLYLLECPPGGDCGCH